MSVVLPAARCAMTRSRMSSSRARSTVPPQASRQQPVAAPAVGRVARRPGGPQVTDASRDRPPGRRSERRRAVLRTCGAIAEQGLAGRATAREPGGDGVRGRSPGVDSAQAGEDLVAPAGERVEHRLLRSRRPPRDLDVVDAELLVAVAAASTTAAAPPSASRRTGALQTSHRSDEVALVAIAAPPGASAASGRGGRAP